MRDGHALDYFERFGFGQNRGQTLGFLGANSVNRILEVLAENLAVEERQRAKGLILGRGGNVFFGRKMTEKCLDFGAVHFAWMAFVVKDAERES